jgi:bla regulator protein BlaR1
MMHESDSVRKIRMKVVKCRAAIVLGALVSLSFCGPQVMGQATAAKLPAFDVSFDVIVVKPNSSGERPSIDFDGGNFSATNFSVKMLVLFAYDLKDDQLFGIPKWANEQRFDMKAKVLDADPTLLQHLTNDQKREIEQTILTERFGLTFHHETKVLPVYELVVDKNGPKFQPSKIEDGQRGANGLSAGSLHTNNHDGNADMASTAVPISSLVNVLSRQTERIVVDQTGLTGRYDLNLTWSRDDGGASVAGTTAAEQNSPSILTAIQEQLGLRLRPAKLPVGTFVVDHVVLPTGN